MGIILRERTRDGLSPPNILTYLALVWFDDDDDKRALCTSICQDRFSNCPLIYLGKDVYCSLSNYNTFVTVHSSARIVSM